MFHNVNLKITIKIIILLFIYNTIIVIYKNLNILNYYHIYHFEMIFYLN